MNARCVVKKTLIAFLFTLSLAVPGFSQSLIAVMSDMHFHDVYATFEDGSFSGLPGKDGKNATIRTMMAELTSTRL
jgi:hypothetical protein